MVETAKKDRIMCIGKIYSVFAVNLLLPYFKMQEIRAAYKFTEISMARQSAPLHLWRPSIPLIDSSSNLSFQTKFLT